MFVKYPWKALKGVNNKIFTELTIIFTIFKGFLLFYIVLLIYIYVFFVEQIGGEIIEELGDQREALERTRDRVKTISNLYSWLLQP